jgi:hypothetical protein
MDRKIGFLSKKDRGETPWSWITCGHFVYTLQRASLVLLDLAACVFYRRWNEYLLGFYFELAGKQIKHTAYKWTSYKLTDIYMHDWNSRR